jgi:hypothetical protein|eukprot:g2115.t1
MASLTVPGKDSAIVPDQAEADAFYKEEKFQEAAEIYNACAFEDNNVNAQRTLAWIFENGMGKVEQDYARAAELYRLAAAQDDPVSTMNLSQLYFYGNGVRKDAIRGANLLRRLIGRQDFPPARSELARCYFTADGVPFDAEKAIEMWTEAKKKGYEEAKSALSNAAKLKSSAARWQAYQDKVQQEASYGALRYGPYKSIWGAKGYIEYLRSLGEPVPSVNREIKCDRLADGSFIRLADDEILIDLAKEIVETAKLKRPLSSFDLWEIDDCLQRFVCGASPDMYKEPSTNETASFHAARNNHPKLLQRLKRSKCKMDLVNSSGQSILDVAFESDAIKKLLPHARKTRVGGRKFRKGEDWATLAASGMSKALAQDKSSDGALFHDPREVERRRQMKTLSVYGDGKKIYNKGSREYSIIQEIEEMERKRKENAKKDKPADPDVGGSDTSASPQPETGEQREQKVMDFMNGGVKAGGDATRAFRRVEAEKYKNSGNKCLEGGDFFGAVNAYTNGLLTLNVREKEDTLVRALLSNRSAARLRIGEAHSAAADAFDCVEVAPGWHKAYIRLGKACEAMGGYTDAHDWYDMGARCANLQKQKKEASHLRKLADAAAKLKAKGHFHERLAQELNFHSHLFYTPKGVSRKISVADNKDYFDYISDKTDVRVCDTASMDGGRGLYAGKDFDADTVVLEDQPYFTISFHRDLCAYCAKSLDDKICYLADDGNEEYCSSECKDAAWTQYYQVLVGEPGKRMKELRDGLADLGEEESPISSSFHPLAAIKIAAATLAFEKEYGNASEGTASSMVRLDTFDVPAFRCLARPSDLGDEKLFDIQFKVPFAERYNQYMTVRNILGRLDDGRFDFGWYDNVWGMLMLNCISGNCGITDVTNRRCVCLMRLGSFINHSNDPNLALVPSVGESGILKFRATKPIKEGDQLFISYCHPNIEDEERDRLLATQYMISVVAEDGKGTTISNAA